MLGSTCMWGVVLICLTMGWTEGRTDARLSRREGWSETDEYPPETPNLTSRQVREAECSVNCTHVRRRPVCGTDGRTYRSKCEIKRLRQCEGQGVRLESKGRCENRGATLGLAGPLFQGGRCREERRRALSHASRAPTGVFVPECRPDGTFASVQCHAATESCWCVTRDGRPILGSSAWARNINCKHTRGCTSSDRASFTSDLLRLFTEEYARIPKPTPPAYPGAPKGLPIQSESGAVLASPERQVLEWKFTELDIVKDDVLSKAELRSLMRMLKKLVRPKACAKTFAQHCDEDQDGGIGRSEWCNCLSSEQDNTDAHSPPSDSPALESFGLRVQPYDVAHLLRSSAETDEEEALPIDSQLLTQERERRPSGKRRGRGNRRSGESRRDDDDSDTGSSNHRDCQEVRSEAQQTDQLEPEGRIFIPECTSEGLYRKEQCHSATGYCWCVNAETGEPIPGTSTHNVMPDCSQVRVLDYKGCPYSNKKRFLVELLDQLTTQMMEHAQNASNTRTMPEPDPDQSLEEQAARWKLMILDRNNNLILERREWKVFKEEIHAERSLRRCGRNFMKFCDADEDKKIALEEWIECMGLNEQESNLPDNPKRRGPNPFSKYLRSS